MTSLLLAALTLAAEPVRLHYPAPKLAGTQWINGPAPNNAKVTIVHFWTYGCYNCRNNLPAYARWQQRFAGQPVALIGIHTPEFPHEADAANVRAQVERLRITWPVLLDPRMENWRKWKQEFWPCIYLVDGHGQVRWRWDGELNFRGERGDEIMAQKIDKLLKEP